MNRLQSFIIITILTAIAMAVPLTSLQAAAELVVQEVICAYDTVLAGGYGIPISVRVKNVSKVDIELQDISLYFTHIMEGDRNSDYVVSPVPPPSYYIPASEIFVLEFLVDALESALVNEEISIRAVVFGIRQDDMQIVFASSSDQRTLLDRFDTAAWDNNDGSDMWASEWIEYGESDGPGAGVLSIGDRPMLPLMMLQIGDPDYYSTRSLERRIDLSDVVVARLSFDWTRDLDETFSGTIRVQASSDGVDFNDLMVIEPGPVSINSESLDLEPYRTSDASIRFLAEDLNRGRVLFDDVSVTFQTGTSSDRWVVVESGLIGTLALFDSRGTPDRADDELLVLLEDQMIPLNASTTAGGGILFDIPYETPVTYRLVLQYHPIVEWEWEISESEEGYLAFEDPAMGFGRASLPAAGRKEFLLTEGMLPDEEDDPVDCLIGATRDNTPIYEWDMLSDPFTDPDVDEGKTAEYGSVIEGLSPPRWILDGRDAGKHWEVTGKCEEDRSYFHEIWFTPDSEWEHEDLADIFLHLKGHLPETDLSAYHMVFRMIEDDDEPPSISEFGPEVQSEGQDLHLTCLISDPSGVYDDETGSDGQGVYIRWDTDGELLIDSSEMQMVPLGGGYFQTASSLGIFSEGDEIVYYVHACDNDNDTGISDRSCASSPVQTVQILGSLVVYDSPGSLLPGEAYPGDEGISFQIDLSNPNPGSIELDPALTYMTIDYGVTSTTSYLDDATVLMSGVTDLITEFEPVDIPAGAAVPDTVEITLHLEGWYDSSIEWSQDWTLSQSNRLILLEPVVSFESHSLPSLAENPGARGVEMLRMEVVNESNQPVLLESLIVANTSTGYLGTTGTDADFERIYLYRQGDLPAAAVTAGTGPKRPGDEALLMSRPFEESDSLTASTVFTDGRAVFELALGKTLPPWQPVYYYILADIDTTMASDGDILDLAVLSTDSIFTFGDVKVRFDDAILDSEGATPIDGSMSYQMSMNDTEVDTIWSGRSRQLVMSAGLPSNGRAADLISSLAVSNFGEAEADGVIQKVELWLDDGDGMYSEASDLLLGEMVDTGSRYEISGLGLPVSGMTLLFVTIDAGQGFTEDLEVRFGIPLNGVEYVSGNDGPQDIEIVSPRSQLMFRSEFVNVSFPESTELLDRVFPGQRDVLLLAARVENYTLADIDLDQIAVTSPYPQFECVPDQEIRLYIDDGDGLFDPEEDEAISTGTWTGTGVLLPISDVTFTPDDEAILFVSADIDSFATPDGDTIELTIESPAEMIFSTVTDSEYSIDGSFPIQPANSPVTDGMMSYQLDIISNADSTIAGRLSDILAMAMIVPSNGCEADTINSLTLINTGTARDGHIASTVLWLDDGDDAFDHSRDSRIGDFTTSDMATLTIDALNIPVPGGGSRRLFVTIDLVEGYEKGADVWFQLPLSAVEMSSGNDGPIDRPITAGQAIVIPIPDRITVYSSLLGNKRVHAGQTNILNMVLGAYNSYSEDKLLGSLTLLKSGSSRLEEIRSVSAWSDADGDGLFDQDADELLGTVDPEGVLVKFAGLDLPLTPFKSSLLFITYDLQASGVRDSVSVDFSISDQSLIGFDDATTRIEGHFPLESAGIDLTDGMIASQIEVLGMSTTRAVPGDEEIPCYTITMPCNGTDTDILTGLSLSNSGTALPTGDIEYLRIWKEAGGEPGRYDSGIEEFIGYLVWNGSAWENITPLDLEIDCGGLTIHATVDVSDGAEDGRTVSVFVPAGGIEVGSGNDGPIDIPLKSSRVVAITTDPLLVSFDHLDPVSAGQVFDLTFNVFNAADTMISAVSPDSFSWSGDGAVTVLSGPVPASIDIEGVSSELFTWTIEALTPGEVVFSAKAIDAAGSAASMKVDSDTLSVEQIPSGFNLTLDDLTPVNLNRGHEQAEAIEFIATYSSSCVGCAVIDLESITLLFTDGEGTPVAVGSVASAIRLEDESMVIAVLDTEGMNDSAAVLTPPGHVDIAPGEIETFRISIDIAPDATASEFVIVVDSGDHFAFIDHNSGETVAYGGSSFPWSTNTVTLKDPALELMVSLDGTSPDWINTDQPGIGLFTLTLTNLGSLSGADINISDISFDILDQDGAPVSGSSVISAFRLKDPGGFLVYAEEDPGTGSGIVSSFVPGLIVSAGMPLTLEGSIDASSSPTVEGLSLSIDSAIKISARDVNSGESVVVLPDAGGGYDFPMGTGVARFMDPLSAISVSVSSQLPPAVTASDTDVGIFDIVLTHSGASGESDAMLSSLTMRILNQLGEGIAANSIIEGLTLLCADTTIGSFYSSVEDTSSYITVTFSGGLRVAAGQTITIYTSLDIDDDASESYFQFQVDGAGIEVSDATSGERFNALSGTFPLSSGISEIVLPADRVSFACGSSVPANVAAGEEIHLFDLSFSRGIAEGGSVVQIDRIDLDFRDENDLSLDAGIVVESVRLVSSGADIPAVFESIDGRLRVDLGGLAEIASGEVVSAALYCTLAGDPGVSSMKASILEESYIVARDAASGAAVAVYPFEETDFPFETPRMTILDDDIEASFSNYPNPFTPADGPTRIAFYLPSRSRISLNIYTLTGRLVKRLVDSRIMDSGLHQEISWDGLNGDGQKVISGVYFMILDVEGEEQYRRKVSVIR